MKTLAKIEQDSVVAGVCGGIAYALGIPAWIVRMVTFLLCVFLGFPLLGYLLLWVFMPKWHKDPEDYAARTQQSLSDN